MTSFLPLGGADFSGSVIRIFFGGALYFSSRVCASLTPPEAPPLLELEFEDPPEELLSEPQAASASAATSAVMIATRPRAPRRPRFMWWVMGVSLLVCVWFTMGATARP